MRHASRGGWDMIAACPKCGARYRIERGKLRAEGARLRCSRCEAVFRVSPPQPAESEPREEIPVAMIAPEPGRASAASAPPVTDAERARLVLVADAEIEAGKQIASALVDGGLQPVLVHDGVEAILTIQRTLPRAVVLDAGLPKMFGFQICELMKRNESLRSIQVVLVGAIHHRDRYRRAPSEIYGADAYLERHQLLENLLETLRGFGLPVGSAVAARSAPRPAHAPLRAPREAHPVSSAAARASRAGAPVGSGRRPGAGRRDRPRRAPGAHHRVGHRALQRGEVQRAMRSRQGARGAARAELQEGRGAVPRAHRRAACATSATSSATSCCAWRARGACGERRLRSRATAKASLATSRATTRRCAGSRSSAPVAAARRRGDAAARRSGSATRAGACARRPSSAWSTLPGDWPRRADALIAALGDGENPGRRNAAVEALVRMRRAHGAAAARGERRARDVDVRKLVVDALAGIGERARDAARWSRCSRDDDPNVRAAAADALGAIGGADAASRAARRGDARGAKTARAFLRAARARACSRRRSPRAICCPRSRTRCCGRPRFDVLGRAGRRRGVEVLLKGLATDSRATREAAMRRAAARRSRGWMARDAERLLARDPRSRRARTASLVQVAVRATRGGADLGTRLRAGAVPRPRSAPSAVVLPMLRRGRRRSARGGRARRRSSSSGRSASGRIDAQWNDLDGRAARATPAQVFGRTHGERGAARLLAALDDADPEIRAAAAARARRGAACADALPALVRRLELAAAEAEPEAEEEVAALIDALVALASRRRRRAGRRGQARSSCSPCASRAPAEPVRARDRARARPRRRRHERIDSWRCC